MKLFHISCHIHYSLSVGLLGIYSYFLSAIGSLVSLHCLPVCSKNVYRLGRLDAIHAPEILDTVAHRLASLDPQTSLVSLPPIMPTHWRGRMGLSKEEQLAIASQ